MANTHLVNSGYLGKSLKVDYVGINIVTRFCISEGPRKKMKLIEHHVPGTVLRTLHTFPCLTFRTTLWSSYHHPHFKTVQVHLAKKWQNEDSNALYLTTPLYGFPRTGYRSNLPKTVWSCVGVNRVHCACFSECSLVLVGLVPNLYSSFPSFS